MAMVQLSGRKRADVEAGREARMRVMIMPASEGEWEKGKNKVRGIC